MNEEIKKEEQKIIAEWIQRAIDDLESAQIILKESDNYDIVAYHAHQAIDEGRQDEKTSVVRET